MRMFEYLVFALIAGIRSADEVLRMYNTEFEVFKKPDNSPVTTIDLKVHEICFEELSKTQLPILSEEGQIPSFEEVQSWGKYWCIDPIDGTSDLVKKTGNFCISIGLIDQNTSYVGVLIAPIMDKFYFASESVGSFRYDGSITEAVELLNHENFLEAFLARSTKLPLPVKADNYTLLASNFYKGKKDLEYHEELRQLHEGVMVESIGSVIKIGMVAEGLAHEYTRWSAVNFWDIAAGHAIAKYSGLPFVDPLNNQPIQYQNSHFKVERYSLRNTLI